MQSSPKEKKEQPKETAKEKKASPKEDPMKRLSQLKKKKK
jgi:hypothetical protein